MSSKLKAEDLLPKRFFASKKDSFSPEFTKRTCKRCKSTASGVHKETQTKDASCLENKQTQTTGFKSSKSLSPMVPTIGILLDGPYQNSGSDSASLTSMLRPRSSSQTASSSWSTQQVFGSPYTATIIDRPNQEEDACDLTEDY